jgi:Domain of Unknown Function (DUF1080)
MKSSYLLTVISFASISSLAIAGKNVAIKSTTPVAEKPAAEANFESGPLEKPWAAMKGDWTVKDGAMVGKEKLEDKHNAVLALNLPMADSVIRFSFKLGDSKLFHVSYNHEKGHLFRVQVTPKGLQVNMDKDKSDETSKATVLGKADADFAINEWHTMQVEVHGEKVIVQTDNGAKVEGANPALKQQKTGFRFVTKGESLLLDDVKVWDVAP